MPDIPFAFREFTDNVLTTQGQTPTHIKVSLESQEYQAVSFQLKDHAFLYRQAKVTPKKSGYFVTLWKREKPDSEIAPFSQQDNITGVVINVEPPVDEDNRTNIYSKQHSAYFFLFPADVLLKQGIFTSDTKDGKRGFRVYAPWDMPTSKQALQTQKWQTQYFHAVHTSSHDSSPIGFLESI